MTEEFHNQDFKPRLRRFDFGARALQTLAMVVLFYLFFLPFLIIIPLSLNDSRFMAFPPKAYSLRWFENYLSSKDWIEATIFSAQVAVTTMIVATIFGTMAAVSLVRGRYRGKNLLNYMFLMPIIVPVVITATALFLFLGNLNLTDTFLGMVMGHTVLALPFVIINVGAVLTDFNISLEQAAMSLGANPLEAFIKVTFPIIRPGVISGAAFSFLASWDEVVVAIFITGVEHYTLPRKMWESIRYEINPMLAVIAVILTSIAILSILLSRLTITRMKG
jgi:ABC-type spermidine/putrescine transport system permease subunit II